MSSIESDSEDLESVEGDGGGGGVSGGGAGSSGPEEAGRWVSWWVMQETLAVLTV